MSALEVHGLRVVRDGAAQLEIDHLDVAEGAIVVVTGATDSGKTLLAAVLAGRAAAVGAVRVRGRQVSGGAAARRRAGLVVTIADGARIAGCTVGEALRLAGPRHAAAALARFPQLAERAGVRAELLSGGEQQLLQVACAWCAQPRALVLDSPTTGLAPDAAQLVRDAASECATGGAGVLWLDQSDKDAPERARWRLAAGAFTAATEAGSASGSA